MNKIISSLLLLIPALFLTGCITENMYSSGYSSSRPYNGTYISSTGYGVGDYGLGFGTNYNPRYGLEDFGIEH